METERSRQSRQTKFLLMSLVAAVFAVYYFCNPKPQHYYDYTFRVAENFLRGSIAFGEKPPSWLNEFVPFDGGWYSVFPLGSVLSMIPFAFFKTIGLIAEMPAALIAALAASAAASFLFLMADQYELGRGKKLLLAAGVLFGTWMWTNLAMAGAWQLALGWAVVGELGAIYFTVFRRRPLVAGFFFALAFGNRTEILLTAPIFMWLLVRKKSAERCRPGDEESFAASLETPPKTEDRKPKTENGFAVGKAQIAALALFCAAPFVLGVATLVYNFVRFDSFADFGYARIPGVLDEPWYRHGIFSLSYIPLNFREMLYSPWKRIAEYPYFVPSGFGGSIWWSSPLILFALRFGARDCVLKYAAWTAIAALTFLLWIHGNPGGWQFGYRYAMILLPWIYLILLETSPRRITPLEALAYGFSFLVNAYATYLFFWTDYVKP